MKMMDIEKANMGQCFLDNTTFADEAKLWLETRGRSFSLSFVIKVAGILRELLPDLVGLEPEPVLSYAKESSGYGPIILTNNLSRLYGSPGFGHLKTKRPICASVDAEMLPA